MALTLEQDVAILKAEVARLAQHNQELLNTSNKLAYAAINELEARAYPQRRNITQRSIGCKVYAESKLATFSSEKLYELARQNAIKLQRAINEGFPLLFPRGILVIDKVVESTRVAVDLLGEQYESVIRLLPPQDGSVESNCLVIDVSQGPKQVFVKNLVFEAGAHFTSSIALTVKGFALWPAADRIYSKPLGRIENVHIRGQNTYNTPPPWPNAFFGGIEVINPNCFTIEGCVIQGNGYTINTDTGTRTILPFQLPSKLGTPQMVLNTGSFGIQFVGNRASIENKVKFCDIYDVQTGLISYTPEWSGPFKPGIEGLRIDGCTFAGVYDGIWIESKSYGTPGFWIGNGTHVAASRKAIFGRNIRQGWVDNCLLYNKGNNDGYVNFASFIELRECSDFRITGNDCNYFHPAGAPNTYNDAYGFLLQGKVINGEYYNPSVANFIGGGNYIVNTKPDCTKPAIWLQGDFTNNNQVPENQNMVFGYKDVVLTNNPYNYVGKHMPSDDADGYTPAHNMALSREITGEYLNEFGELVSGVIGRTLNPSGATLSRDEDGFWILDLEGCRSDTVFIASNMIAERGPGDANTDVPYEDFVLKQVVMRPGRCVRIMSERTMIVRHNTNELFLQGQRDLLLEPFEVVTLTYRADQAFDRIEEVNKNLSGTGRLITNDENLLSNIPYTLNKTIYSAISVAEQYWHLIQYTKEIGGIIYEYQRAVNLFRNGLIVTRIKTGEGWSTWRVSTDRDNEVVTSADNLINDRPYILNSNIYAGVTSGEQYWHLIQRRHTIGGIDYQFQRATNLFRSGLNLCRLKTGSGWTNWQLETQIFLQSSNTPTTSDIQLGDVKVHRNSTTGKKFIFWNDNGTIKKLNLSADFISYAGGYGTGNYSVMIYDEDGPDPESIKRTGHNDFYYALKNKSSMLTDLFGEIERRYGITPV